MEENSNGFSNSSSNSSAKKKAVFLILALAVLILAVFLYMKAVARVISITGASGAVGSVVEVPVTIKGNPGIAGFVLQVTYDDSYLEPVDAVPSEMLSDGGFLSDLTLPKRLPREVAVLWSDVADMAEDGTLCTLTFRVKKEAPKGTPLTLSYRSGDIANASLERVEFKLKDAAIKTV